MNKSKIQGKPFLKWLGGKSKMIPHILGVIPENIKSYYEPFLGGGSLFIELAKSKKFKRSIIGDSNEELINVWRQVQSNVDHLIKELKNGKYLYNEKTYKSIRSINVDEIDEIERAARFIYLNKTCFNGLYRVNSRGIFNVPFGKFTDPKICDEENLRIISSLLEDTKIMKDDFTKIVEKSKKGDLVYIDPPYIPLSKTSSFSGYTSSGFSESDHWRLAGTFNDLVSRGVHVILSNSSSPLSFKLYGDHKIITLDGTRSVAGPSSWRNSVKEILVVGNA